MLDFINNQFDLDKTEQYKLSIQISLDGFLFCVFNSNNICIAAKNIKIGNTEDLFNIFDSNKILLQHFAQTNCIYVSPKTTLIPEKLFDKNACKYYINYISETEDNDIILHKRLKEIEAECVFCVPENVYNAVCNKQPNTQFYNQSIPIIYQALSKKTNNAFVHFWKQGIDIAFIENNKLRLFNSFKTETLNDAVYYVYNIYKQLKIDTKTTMFLSGLHSYNEIDAFTNFFINATPEIDGKIAFNLGRESASLLSIISYLKQCEL